jgi:hypothetical protein
VEANWIRRTLGSVTEKRSIFCLAAILVIGILVVLLGGRQLLIIWYTKNVQREYDTALRTPPSAIQGEHLKKYERYRDTLVTLGYLEKIEINLRYIPKGDKRKIRIARLLRNQTTMTLKWIADRLHMGVWTYLSNRLYHVQP